MLELHNIYMIFSSAGICDYIFLLLSYIEHLEKSLKLLPSLQVRKKC